MRGIEGKVVVLGSSDVGKTRLVMKYIKNTSHRDIVPAIASLFTCKVILDDIKIKMQIWDTAGQERFKAVAPMYYRNANAAILVFDLSKYETFVDIKSWIQELHRIVQDPMILVLVGNKLDLQAQRAVSRDEAIIFGSTIGARYFETSAQTDEGLEQVFQTIAMGLVRLADEGKSLTLRQFNSCDSISAYTTMHNTAYNRSFAALDNDGAAMRLLAVGIPVEGDDVKVNGVGRLETPSWSIEHIALGEEEYVGWCC